MMSTTSVIYDVPCKLNGSESHSRSLENWFAVWDIVVWQSWLRMVGTLGIELCPKFYAWPPSSFHVGRRLNATKLWNSIDASHSWYESNMWRCIWFYDSYLPFPQESVHSGLAKLFSISIFHFHNLLKQEIQNLTDLLLCKMATK